MIGARVLLTEGSSLTSREVVTCLGPGQGVREVTDASSRDAALGALLLDGQPVMAQQHATEQYAQVQGLFDRGRLVAVRTSVQRAAGIGGSAAARLSVDHATPREQVAVLGETLAWHGGLTLDYFHKDGSPQYIECNPRTVEPGNGAASGVNIPELQIRVTLAQEFTRRLGWDGQTYARTGRWPCCWETRAVVDRAGRSWVKSAPRSLTGASTGTVLSS